MQRLIGSKVSCLLWLCLLWPGIAATGWCQNVVKQGLNFPTRATATRGALRVDVSYLGPYGNGSFTKIFVTISSTPATPADRHLTVVFYAKAYPTSAPPVAYRYPVTLVEGTTQVTVEIPHVPFENQYSWDVQVWENGRDIEDHRSSVTPQQLGYHWSMRDNNKLESINFLYDAESELGQAEILALTSKTGDTTGLLSAWSDILEIEAASTDWRMYLSYPQWMIDAAAWRKLAASRPEAVDAICKYVAAGGTFIIFDARQAGELDDIASQLPGDAERAGQTMVIAYMNGRFAATAHVLDELPVDVFDNLRFVLGPSRAFVANELLIQPSHDGDWFWRNMILAVGKPPVWTFCAMVTLFGGLLGPGLLYYTGRVRRRSLMILLVPCISFLATLSIIAYGVLYEGFDTHTRTVSVQFVDEQGRGFIWARQSYFSGLPPREGLIFPQDAYVRSVPEPKSTSPNYSNPDPRRASRYILLDGEQQQWGRWLQARQQQQLMVGRPLEQAMLPVKLERINAGSLRIINLSETKLPVVIARGTEDDYFVAAVEAGKSVEVEALDRVPAGAMAARLFADFRPEIPLELQGNTQTLQLGWRSRGGIVGNPATDVIIRVMNSHLTDKLQLPPGGVAVVTQHSDVAQPPLAGKPSNDVHLIIGKQAW
jgi:hypothetical protein